MDADLKKSDFKISILGYDRQEIKQFHQEALVKWEALEAENARLRTELDSIKEEIDKSRREGRFVQEALVTAQKSADEIRNSAQKHADLVVEEARQLAEAEKESARRRVDEMNREVERLRQDRKRFIDDFRLMLERYQYEVLMVSLPENVEVGS